jgi:putative inorganic carbon (HCO3(-)) transporter
MRDYIIFGVVFGMLPFILKRPTLGVLMFTWLSLMNPHRLAYGAAHDFPFAAIVAGVTVMALFLSKEKKSLPMTSVTVLLLVFMAWMTLTGLTATEPTRAWGEWNRVFKTFFMVLVTVTVISSEKDIKLFAWTVGLSLGFYGVKGGLFTLLSGGAYRVLGPDSSYISDNNDLALALLTTVPIIWFLQLQAKNKWIRLALGGLAVLTLVSVLGSYSRGALLGAGAMLLLLWLKSRNKMQTGLLLLLLIPLVYSLMPEEWFARMATLNDVKSDSSAMGRVNAWHFAFNLALDNLMGGGFLTFTPKMFALYAPDPHDLHAPHSIYFQVMGEHGFIGLGIFLLILASAWRTGSRVIKFGDGLSKYKWASDLAAMCQVSLAGYAVGGAFLSLAYFDLLYDIILIIVLLEKLQRNLPNEKSAVEPASRLHRKNRDLKSDAT